MKIITFVKNIVSIIKAHKVCKCLKIFTLFFCSFKKLEKEEINKKQILKDNKSLNNCIKNLSSELRFEEISVLENNQISLESNDKQNILPDLKDERIRSTSFLGKVQSLNNFELEEQTSSDVSEVL